MRVHEFYGACSLGRLLKVATFRLCQDASLFHFTLGWERTGRRERVPQAGISSQVSFSYKTHILYYDFQIMLWIALASIFCSARKYFNIYSGTVYIRVCICIHKRHIHIKIYYSPLKSFLRSVTLISISCNCFCYPVIDYLSVCVSVCAHRGRPWGGLQV